MIYTKNRLTWEEIKKKYPHQYVGLTEVEYGRNKASVISAIVKYTDKNIAYNDMLLMYIRGEILLRYTTLDEDELEGLL